MDIRIISLEQEVERRKHISELMEKNQLTYDWFNALNKETGLILAKQYNLLEKIDTNLLSPGEIGCMMSHISLWYELVEKNISWMCIFEDDIHLGQSSSTFLNSTNWIPKGCDCLKLEKMDDSIKIYQSPSYQLDNNRVLHRLSGCHLGAAAYILSLEGAKKLLSYIEKLNNITAIDHVIFEEITNKKTFITYQMLPALSIQDDVLNKTNITLTSAIESERRKVRQEVASQKPKLNIKQKVKRETVRLKKQITTLVSDLINRRRKVHLEYK